MYLSAFVFNPTDFWAFTNEVEIDFAIFSDCEVDDQ